MFETLRIGTESADRGLILSSGTGRWRSRGSLKTGVRPGSMPSRGRFEGTADYSECSSCSSPLLWLSRLKSGFSFEASLCSKGQLTEKVGPGQFSPEKEFDWFVQGSSWADWAVLWGLSSLLKFETSHCGIVVLLGNGLEFM